MADQFGWNRISAGGVIIAGMQLDPSALVRYGTVLEMDTSKTLPIFMQELTFTETSGAGVWTGTITLPANSRIIDIGCDAQALWTSQTSASLIVGDGVDPDGFFTATDLKATDLLAGEINNFEHPGGLAGVYIASEQRNLYSAAARSVIAVITKVGTTGTAGRTRIYVVYSVTAAVAATKV